MTNNVITGGGGSRLCTHRMLIINAVKLNCAYELSNVSSTALLVTGLGLKPK